MRRSRQPGTALLAELRRELASRRIGSALRRRRIVAEAASHLRESVAGLGRAGLQPADAEREAVRRFGRPAAVAAAWSRQWRRAGPVSDWQLDWILRTAAGSLIGLALALGAGAPLAPLIGMVLLLPAVGLVVGSSVGLSQWLVLRPADRTSGWWVPASGIGVAGGLTLSTVVVELAGFTKTSLLSEMTALLLIGGGTGAALALGQRLLLPHRFRTASGWVGRSAAGAALGMAAGGVAAEFAFGTLRTGAGLLALAVASGIGLAAATAAPLDHPSEVVSG